jgi:hypothetical protein
MEQAEVGDAICNRRATRTAGVGPAVDTLFEEEPVDDELASTVEQLSSDRSPSGPSKR